MKLEIKKSFLKDIKKINDKKLLDEIKNLFNIIPQAKSLQDIPNLKKMQGYKTYYRIRVGKYRIGIEYVNGNVYFIRLLHRKEIYKFFP